MSIRVSLLQEELHGVRTSCKARAHSHRRTSIRVSLLQEELHGVRKSCKARAHSHRRTSVRVSLLQEELYWVRKSSKTRAHSHAISPNCRAICKSLRHLQGWIQVAALLSKGPEMEFQNIVRHQRFNDCILKSEVIWVSSWRLRMCACWKVVI